MKIDTSDYYPWDSSRRRPAEENVKDCGTIEEADVPESQSEDKPIDDKIEVATDTDIKTPASEVHQQEEEPPHGFVTIISHLLSWVLSPVVVPTLGIISVFSLSMLSYAPIRAKWIIIGIVFTLTCVIPCAAIFILTKFGDVKDMALTRRTDRLYPYLITGACLLGCGYYLTTTGLPDWVGFFYIGASIATGINLIINFWWKISAHGAGIGGFIALFLVLNRYGLPSYNLWGWVVAAVIAGGMLGAARVWLGRHTPLQTVAGEIVGFVSVMMMENLF